MALNNILRNRILELKEKGKSNTEIVKIVRNEGIKTSRGNLPNYHTVAIIVRRDYKKKKKLRLKKVKKIPRHDSAIFDPGEEVKMAWVNKKTEKVCLLFATTESAAAIVKAYLGEAA